MKRNYFNIFACLLCLFGTIGCNHQSLTSPYMNYVTVIKLDKPEYKQYVLVPENGYAGHAGFYGEANIFGDGALPYWELLDDYLLIDWRWYMFPRYQTTYYLIFEPWTAQNSYAWSEDNTWYLDTCQYIKNPIKRRYDIDMTKVNGYLGTAELYQEAYSETHGMHLIDTKLWEEFRTQTTHMDSVWAYTQQQLNTVIEQGKLKKMVIKDLFKN